MREGERETHKKRCSQDYPLFNSYKKRKKIYLNFHFHLCVTDVLFFLGFTSEKFIKLRCVE